MPEPEDDAMSHALRIADTAPDPAADAAENPWKAHFERLETLELHFREDRDATGRVMLELEVVLYRLLEQADPYDARVIRERLQDLRVQIVGAGTIDELDRLVGKMNRTLRGLSEPSAS